MRDGPEDAGALPHGTERIGRSARAVVGRTLRAGAQSYVRKRDLPRLIRVIPRPDRGETAAEVETIVRLLDRALRAERNRARSGHWTYDLNRHIALHQAHVAERTQLAAMIAKPEG